MRGAGAEPDTEVAVGAGACRPSEDEEEDTIGTEKFRAAAAIAAALRVR